MMAGNLSFLKFKISSFLLIQVNFTVLTVEFCNYFVIILILLFVTSVIASEVNDNAYYVL